VLPSVFAVVQGRSSDASGRSIPLIRRAGITICLSQTAFPQELREKAQNRPLTHPMGLLGLLGSEEASERQPHFSSSPRDWLAGEDTCVSLLTAKARHNEAHKPRIHRSADRSDNCYEQQCQRDLLAETGTAVNDYQGSDGEDSRAYTSLPFAA
jgi:hypothetical protein